jgi:hypothetical protein
LATSENWNWRPNIETQRDVDQVDKPRECAQPARVESSRDREHSNRHRQPEQAASKRRAWRQRGAGAIRIGHQQANHGQRGGVEGQLDIEALPRTAAALRNPLSARRPFDAQDAHQLPP